MASRCESAFEKEFEFFALPRTKDPEINYVRMKSLFYKEIKDYFEKNKSWDNNELTQQELSNIIKDVKTGEVLQKNGCTLNPSQCNNMSKYEVLRGPKGQETLILKRSQLRDPPVKVPASENIFDIILNAHLDNDHGSQKQIIDKISPIFMIPKIYYDAFSPDTLCTVCQKAITPMFKNFGDCGHVALINMSTIPDEKFNFILHYVDKVTNFTLLRPLIWTNESEIAMELLKIFFDFGAPKKLQCLNVQFFHTVMQTIKKAYPNFNIPIVITDMKSNVDAPQIVQLVETWKKYTSCNSWSIGVYIIQWELNNRSKANEVCQRTPYSKVFRHRNTLGGDLNEISEEVVTVDTFGSESPNEVLDSENNENVNRLEQQEAEEISLLPHNKVNLVSVDKLQKTLGELMSQTMKVYSQPNVQREDSSGQRNSNIIEQQAKQNPISNMSQIHTEDLGILIKTEDDSSPEDFPTSPIKIQDSQSVPLSFLSNSEKNITNSEFVEEITLIDNVIVKNTESQTLTKTCHVCHKTVIKSFTCDRCKKGVHLYCSLRHVVSSSNSDVHLSTICITCNMIEDRIKELKKKSNELDNLIRHTEATKEKKTLEFSC